MSRSDIFSEAASAAAGGVRIGTDERTDAGERLLYAQCQFTFG